mmetsp:Transcript_4237/g.6242  ORF Transcript_4237/g.6242 Transcript_4237/m.6242 type:complete len:87 (-) Transcript_4237:192-452(-)
MVKKTRAKFRTFSYKGVELSDLVKKNEDELKEMFPSHLRRKMNRKNERQKVGYAKLLKKLRKAKAECGVGEKPKAIKTQEKKNLNK